LIFLAFVFVPLNWLAIRLLVRIHPRRKRFVVAAAVLGNVMWLFFPILNQRSDFSRFVRATFGPPWFAWQVFTFLYCAFLVIVVIAWLPFTSIEFRRFAHWPSRVFLALILAGSVIGFYQALVPLRIERVPIVLHDLPPELDGFRIALMADLHVGLYTRKSRLRTIFATADALQPNVIILAGDLIDDDPYFVPKLLTGTDPASRPMIAVLGNHEMYGDPVEAIGLLRDSRIQLLVNEGTSIGRLWIAGLSDFAARTPALAPNLDAALANKPRGVFPLLVAHQPKAFDLAIARHLPTTLVAHTHGGQLGFRPLHWSLAGLFLRYHMGLYDVAGSQLYVNTGTGYWLLPFRLGMTPEITLLELRRAGSPPRSPRP
jgi:predicted MPP superfamily phosphohydrolase